MWYGKWKVNSIVSLPDRGKRYIPAGERHKTRPLPDMLRSTFCRGDTCSYRLSYESTVVIKHLSLPCGWEWCPIMALTKKTRTVRAIDSDGT